jgi:hypothetical protein
MDLWRTAASNFRMLTYNNFQCIIKIMASEIYADVWMELELSDKHFTDFL